jgi:shikimate dehydrogenase
VIRGTTRLAAVLGWPVEHSRSPQLLNAAFAATGIDAVMVPMGVPPEELALAVAGLRAVRALGASVTIPHKLAVASLCGELSATARAIGAVNCLHFADDRIVGHNTDCDGFVDGLRAAGLAAPAHVVLLGAGGAARAVAYGLRDAQTIDVIARRPEAVDWWGPTAPEELRAAVKIVPWTENQLRTSFARADLLVDCTPIGLGGANEATLVGTLPIEALAPTAWVASLVYHRPTILLERARVRGHSTVDGRAMFVQQGARAFTIWTRVPAPVDVMRRALDDALRSPGT